MLRVVFSKNNLTQFQSNLNRILNLMKPVSVKIGTSNDTYTAKVTLKYYGQCDETVKRILQLQEADCFNKAFSASCEVFAYDLDEEGNPDNCYMFKKPTSYEYTEDSDKIKVKIEFDELHGGPNIDEKCKEVEKLRYLSTVMRKLMKDEFDRNSKKEDDTMKHFSDCVGMCATCASKGRCLAGIGDNDYVMADKTELIRRLKNDKLGEISIEEIKKVLKKEYNYDYDKEINNTKATTRISKHEYYLKIAEAVSLRGTCLRRKFGSIIVKDDRIVSTGYVGAPRGRINCCDRGTCYRMEHNVPSGERYELCRSCHSEMNAIIQASPEEMKDATLYLVGLENDGSYTNADCCSMCKRVIINAGISTVVARQADCGFKTILVSDWIKNDDSLDIDHKGY